MKWKETNNIQLAETNFASKWWIESVAVTVLSEMDTVNVSNAITYSLHITYVVGRYAVLWDVSSNVIAIHLL